MAATVDTPSSPPSPQRKPRRFLRSALRVLFLLVLVIGLFGVWVTQPVFVPRDKTGLCADPALLRAHVRKLSVEFFPRSWEDATNLVRCTEYIRTQFVATGAQVTNQHYVCGCRGWPVPYPRTGQVQTDVPSQDRDGPWT